MLIPFGWFGGKRGESTAPLPLKSIDLAGGRDDRMRNPSEERPAGPWPLVNVHPLQPYHLHATAYAAQLLFAVSPMVTRRGELEALVDLDQLPSTLLGIDTSSDSAPVSLDRGAVDRVG